MKLIENLKNIENKYIILRLDLNVPIKNGKIIDTNRIDKIIPTLNFLIKNKAKIIIISHVGRPNGKVVKELSLEPVSLCIKYKINKNLILLKENIFNLNKSNIFKNSNDELVLLENIRFYPEEKVIIINFQEINSLVKYMLMMHFHVHIEIMHLYQK